MLNFRILRDHFFRQWTRRVRRGPDAITLDAMLHDPIKPITIHVELVHPQLITHPQVNQQHAGQSRRETNQVDEEHALEAFEVPEDEKEIMSDHAFKVLRC